ncbi:MAG TPA: 3-deoxy-7-phosphoheptulonate synthase [Candidatus Angelobacter sp.]|nr:3-deoxy-7-phosphoheptulonate synthase [Candidatus Angelobacter sp.]
MHINMSITATEADIQQVMNKVKEVGLKPHITRGVGRSIITAVGGSCKDLEMLKHAPGVEDVVAVSHPFKLVSRHAKSERTRVFVGDVCFGGDEAVVIAGPCSVESYEQLLTTARGVKAAGASMLRGGAYKPRTSPYDFQGLGVEALRMLHQVREETGLPVITEVMCTDDIEMICEYADMLQIGARNMQNFSLLRQLGQIDKPVLLKRGPSATVKEWLLAAEYLLAGGNRNVVLCERGIKTFETEMRNTLDLGGMSLARSLSHLPVIADPSHGTGRRDLIMPASRAALAAGADGLIIEVHPSPEHALSDGAQSLNLEEFASVMNSLSAPMRPVARAHAVSV